MLRIRAAQLIPCVLALMVAASVLASSSLAESTATVTGGFTTAEAGVFTVGLSAKPDSGCAAAPVGAPVFGPFVVDAVGVSNGVTPEPIDFCVLYTDTQAGRGPFTVQLSIGSFELKADQVPTFDGADQAHFQIPNRYLVLSTIGQVTGGSVEPGVGPVSDVQADAGGNFSSGSLRIASVAQGMGSGSPTQELGMTLNVPAGVYPGEYDSTITVETYTGP
jgi:hypothetical protein